MLAASGHICVWRCWPWGGLLHRQSQDPSTDPATQQGTERHLCTGTGRCRECGGPAARPAAESRHSQCGDVLAAWVLSAQQTQTHPTSGLWELVKVLSYLIYPVVWHHRWGTTVDFTTSFLHSSWFLAFRSSIFHSRPVHSLMLSSHRFLCLPLCLPPWTVPCRIVLASPDDHVTCPYHFCLRLFTEVRFSYGLMAFPILILTSSLVMWSLYEILRSLRKHLISNACIFLLVSAVMVHVNSKPKHTPLQVCECLWRSAVSKPTGAVFFSHTVQSYAV